MIFESRLAGRPLAFTQIHRDIAGQSAFAGFLVFRAHISCRLPHRIDDNVERDLRKNRISLQRQGGSGNRFDRAHAIAFDTGNLHETADGIAGQPQVMFMAISAASADCAGVPPNRSASAARGHRRRHANLSLTATSAAEIVAQFLENRADLGSG